MQMASWPLGSVATAAAQVGLEAKGLRAKGGDKMDHRVLLAHGGGGLLLHSQAQPTSSSPCELLSLVSKPNLQSGAFRLYPMPFQAIRTCHQPSSRHCLESSVVTVKGSWELLLKDRGGWARGQGQHQDRPGASLGTVG